MNSPALIGRPCPGSGGTSAAFDGGLANEVLVAQGVAVARLRPEFLCGEHRDTLEALKLLLHGVPGRVPFWDGVAEDAYSEVDLSGAERLFPVLRIVDVDVRQARAARAAIPCRKGSGKLRKEYCGTSRASRPA